MYQINNIVIRSFSVIDSIIFSTVVFLTIAVIAVVIVAVIMAKNESDKTPCFVFIMKTLSEESSKSVLA